MTTLSEVLQEADRRRIAVGHFNVSDLVTLYGGSDTADADLRAAISAGMTVVHINTEVRL